LWVYDTTTATSAAAVTASAEGATPTTVPPKQVVELTGHTDTVASVGFNFDGTLALTGSYDGTVKVWKVIYVIKSNRIHVIVN
jgi:WD40 repeat protein